MDGDDVSGAAAGTVTVRGLLGGNWLWFDFGRGDGGGRSGGDGLERDAGFGSQFFRSALSGATEGTCRHCDTPCGNEKGPDEMGNLAGPNWTIACTPPCSEPWFWDLEWKIAAKLWGGLEIKKLKKSC